MKFKEFKEEIVKRAKSAEACPTEYKRALNSESFSELLKVVTDNFTFSCDYKIIDCELLAKIGQEICNESNLFYNVSTSIGFLIADSATVEAWGSATVRAWGSATVRAWDSATVEAWGSATVEASDSAYINSYNTIEHKLSGSSICRYKYENRIVISKETKTSTYENI